MSADAKQTCPMCAMEIPLAARKCPYCQSYLRRFDLRNPAWVMLWGSLPLVAFLLIMESFTNRGEDFEKHRGELAVTESEIFFGETKTSATVGVMGSVKNGGKISWKDVNLHVDFLDAAGKRVDVNEREAYGFEALAGTESSFKISFSREFPQDRYAKPLVTIERAKDLRARF